MKNLRWLLAAVLFVSFNIYSVAGDKKIKFKALPRMAQEFYNLNLGKMKIKHIEYDSHDKIYEIELWNDNTVKFNDMGEWIEVDFDKNTPVPLNIINSLPMLARTAFMKKYADCAVMKIERNLSDTSDVHYKIKMISSQTASNFTIILSQNGEIRVLTCDIRKTRNFTESFCPLNTTFCTSSYVLGTHVHKYAQFQNT